MAPASRGAEGGGAIEPSATAAKIDSRSNDMDREPLSIAGARRFKTARRLSVQDRGGGRGIRATTMLAATLALAGCATQERLFLMSPFGGDELPDPDRVNVWPLAYHDGARLSVLWPIFDADERGWSVRPVVSKDGDDLDVLWPISHFDLEDGDFRVVTAYRSDDDVGLFPLAGIGDLNYVGPVWWTRAESDDEPFETAGLFPLVWIDGARTWWAVGPAWVHYRERDGDGEPTGERFDFLLLPPSWFWADPEQEERGAVLFPLWWDLEDVDRRSITLFPLVHFRKDGEELRLVTPLGGRGWNDDGETRFVNVLGPVFHLSEAEGERYTALAWPFLAATRREEGLTWRLFPLVSHAPLEGGADLLEEACLITHRSGEDGWRFNLFPLYRGEHTGEEPDGDAAGGDFERRQEILDGALRIASDENGNAWRVWPIFSTSTAPSLSDRVDPITPIGWHPHEHKDHLHVGTSLVFALDRWGKERDSWQARVATFFTVGRTVTDYEGSQPSESVRDHAGFLFDWFLHERVERRFDDGSTRTARHDRIPFLFELESDGDRSEWDTLLWFVHSESDADESRFHVLWHAYRSIRQGERTSRDVWPFMTWDSAPDATTFSFLWRLLRWERRGERLGGHFLFIPWGDHGEGSGESG
jgi:hypothetical protein